MSSGNYQMETPSSLYFRIKERFCRKLLDDLFPFLREGARVMEIGPGQGQFALECKARQFDYTGMEPSKVLREDLARQGIRVIGGLAPPIPAEGESFDFVISSTMLEHLPSHVEAIRFVSEMNRILKMGGHACIVVPNYLTAKAYFFDMEYTHGYITTERRVTNLLRDAGLTVLDVEYVMNWFWVKSGFFHNLLRHLINVAMVPAHWAFTTWLFEYTGTRNILWKIRKTFCENMIFKAKKTSRRQFLDETE